MNHTRDPLQNDIVEVKNAQAASSVVLVCEHASRHIPPEFGNLGLPPAALGSHIAWDPGAQALAAEMATRLDAILVCAKTSRLIYDCNRPPDAPDAMPVRSEVVDVPGNMDLSATQKSDRTAHYYEPFRAAVASVMQAKSAPILVTVHSFTPIFHGTARVVEIGILNDSDTRLADAMLSSAPQFTERVVQHNEPYGPNNGVTHTLKVHALKEGHLNVMLEVRNDLIADEAAQADMAETLCPWLTHAISAAEARTCTT